MNGKKKYSILKYNSSAFKQNYHKTPHRKPQDIPKEEVGDFTV